MSLLWTFCVPRTWEFHFLAVLVLVVGFSCFLHHWTSGALEQNSFLEVVCLQGHHRCSQSPHLPVDGMAIAGCLRGSVSLRKCDFLRECKQRKGSWCRKFVFLSNWNAREVLHFSSVCFVFPGLLGKILMAIRDAGFEVSAMQMVRILQRVTTYWGIVFFYISFKTFYTEFSLHQNTKTIIIIIIELLNLVIL